ICGGQDGLRRMAPFQRWIAVRILIKRSIRNGQRTSVTFGFFFLRNPTVLDDNALLQAQTMGQCFEFAWVRARSADTAQAQLDRRLSMAQSLNQEMLALVMLNATDAHNLVTVPVGVETLRILQRRVEHLTVDAVELAQPVGHCPGIGENMTGFAQRCGIGGENRIADSSAPDAVRDRAVFSVPQVVIAAKMVDKPKDLAWMP